ncbi:16S rRNA (uracil(1498)-N(3))-methyltransferase [Rhodocytophaga aerolata]|uniref:Ribosomal RNA small subunit methyltransferase E n=1 Tax=Rhodocytophaga aerolata TaxID=455078 RepID=A0ABT8R5U6_9BACT|nr:16S rRNA (uracil(1498)-N(3))-methyltransferase [Rhodocytophaga aerolata]MDO1447465.1 16S rRNA (uracil(1498)-N(3))-methyltransferase [Rhodocytophaga aerolata]
MIVFYNPQFSPATPILPEEEARHGIKVLRMNTGDTLHVTDGKGNMYEAEIASTDIKKCRVAIRHIHPEFGKKPYSIHLAIAPTKNADRTEWLVEKCVELGIDEISFIACERSERRVFKTDRLEKIAVAAMKQSIKAYLPHIHEVIPFRQFIEKPLDGQKFVAHLEEGRRELLQKAAIRQHSYCLLVGPEGDFSPAEIALALEKGYVPVSLGESRLRTETAGMAGCHILNLINNS